MKATSMKTGRMLLALAALAAWTTAPLRADTSTWTGSAGASWNNASNWSAGIPGADDTAVFDGTGTLPSVVALDANQTAAKLVIATTTAFTIGAASDVTAGYTLTLTEVERQDVDGTEGRHTFGAPVTLAPDGNGNSTWTVNGSDVLRMNAVLGATGATTFVKMGTGTFNMYFRSPTYAGPWSIVEGAVSASYGSDIAYNQDGTIKGSVTVGGTTVPAVFAVSRNAIYGNANVLVLTNGSFTASGQVTSGRANSVHVHAGGTASIDSSYFYCYRAYLTGGVINGGAAGRFYNGGYGQALRAYASDSTAVMDAGMMMGAYSTYDSSVEVQNGASVIDLDMRKSIVTTGSGGSGKVLYRSGSGTAVFAMPSTYLNINGTNSIGWRFQAGVSIFTNTTGSAVGKNPTQIDGGATVGGTGFFGGDSSYPNYYLLAQGGSSSSLAVVAPGSVDPTTGVSLIGTLTVGSATMPNKVTFGNHSRLNAQIGEDGTADRLKVYGTLDLASTSDGLVLSVDPDAKSGTYVLASATGGITGTFDTVSGLPIGRSLDYTATTIELTLPPKGTVVIVR